MKIDIEKLTVFLDEWAETPYLAGQCEKRIGVDCIRFVDAGLQQATGQILDPLPREAQDAALHDAEVVQRIARMIAHRFDLKTVGTRPPYRPADVLCVRTKTKGKVLSVAEKLEKHPHHVLIVGPNSIACWHALRTANQRTSKVSWMGVGGVLACYDVLQVWRSQAA